MHSQEPFPIIHRDIKCDNLLIDYDGNIIIGDLGFASTLSSNHAGSVLGTPEYMAPEIFDENYGTGVDVYAFGMCVLEMVSQATPYSECKGNPVQIYKKISMGEKPKMLERIGDLG